MKNINLKENVKSVDISDLGTAIERTKFGLRVGKMEQIRKTIQFLRSLSVIHLEYMGPGICHPARSLSD